MRGINYKLNVYKQKIVLIIIEYSYYPKQGFRMSLLFSKYICTHYQTP